jgi:hypothetical protein
MQHGGGELADLLRLGRAVALARRAQDVKISDAEA